MVESIYLSDRIELCVSVYLDFFTLNVCKSNSILLLSYQCFLNMLYPFIFSQKTKM
jgi:hypothetical protein